ATARERLLARVKGGRAKPSQPPSFPGGSGGSSPGGSTARPRFPGSLPPAHNVPYRRNPNFTGREGALVNLHASLTSGHYAAITQAITGLGGVGKTQLALEYLYRNAADYDVIW